MKTILFLLLPLLLASQLHAQEVDVLPRRGAVDAAGLRTVRLDFARALWHRSIALVLCLVEIIVNWSSGVFDIFEHFNHTSVGTTMEWAP